MDLDLNALRSFVTIAECGGFRRAADVLHLSQSGVSQHVRKLERTLGGPLVEQVSGRGTHFTPLGDALLAEAVMILRVHDEALGRLGTGEPERVLTVGSTEHAADRILPVISRALRRRFPLAAVHFRVDRGGPLNHALDQGTIDVAVFVGESRDGTGTLIAGALPLAWFAAPDWQAPDGGQPLSLVAIEEPCTIRRRALRTLAAHQLQSEVVVEAGNVGGVLTAARAGLGVALLADDGSPPPGLDRVSGLPAVAPEALLVRARRGADPEIGASTARAVADLVGGALLAA